MRKGSFLESGSSGTYAEFSQSKTISLMTDLFSDDKKKDKAKESGKKQKKFDLNQIDEQKKLKMAEFNT